MPQVREYVDENGCNRYRDWFAGVATEAATKAATAVARMAAGNTSGLKGIGPGLAEWRIDWGPGIRLYVHQDGKDLIVLMGGSDKGDQQAEINAAAALVGEYRKRKKVAAMAAKAEKAKQGKASGGSGRRNKKH